MDESYSSQVVFPHPQVRDGEQGITSNAPGEESSAEEQRATTRLEILEIFVEIRDVSTLVPTIRRWTDTIKKIDKASQIERLADVLRFAKEGERIERKYGRNALLDLEHPIVREWVRVGLISKGKYEDIVAAQERYRLSDIRTY